MLKEQLIPFHLEDMVRRKGHVFACISPVTTAEMFGKQNCMTYFVEMAKCRFFYSTGKLSQGISY